MIARISVEESACGECRCYSPANRAIGAKSARASIFREASSPSSCCPVVIAGDGFTQTTFNIFDHALDEVRSEPRWQAARDASINHAAKCQTCKFLNVCGGGYL